MNVSLSKFNQSFQLLHGDRPKRTTWPQIKGEQRAPLTWAGWGDVLLGALKCKGGEGCVYMMTLCLSIKSRFWREAVLLHYLEMADDWALGRAWVARQSNSRVPLVMEGSNRIWCHIFLQLRVGFSSFLRKQNKIQRQGSTLCFLWWPSARGIITSNTIFTHFDMVLEGTLKISFFILHSWNMEKKNWQ